MAAVLPHGALADDAATRPGQHTWVHAIVRWLCITVSLTFLAAVLLAINLLQAWGRRRHVQAAH